MLNFPHPFRGVLLGPPNTGKSTSVKNILIRADPPFKKVTVVTVILIIRKNITIWEKTVLKYVVIFRPQKIGMEVKNIWL